MDGAGTDEETLVEIICSRENGEIKELVDTYERSKYEFVPKIKIIVKSALVILVSHKKLSLFIFVL